MSGRIDVDSMSSTHVVESEGNVHTVWVTGVSAGDAASGAVSMRGAGATSV